MKEKQKLDRRNTYTPTGAPQARGSCDHALNREGTLSVHGLKTSSNNPDVDLQSGMTVRDLRVPVLNMRNQPLMPTTPGSITKMNRIASGIEKTHANDAFVIAGGSVQKRTPPFMVSQRRRNNRCLQLNRKGFKPSIRKRRYSLQPGDTVLFQKEECNVMGIHNVGKSVIIKKGEKRMDVSVKKVELRRYGKGLKFNLQFLPPLKGGGALGAVR